ncbi:helix-turn-helix domain-containing protein [Fulvivirga sp. M361]|uniref:helix-turn-helix domain-containing protein n=1 Tax=Fulvivirga sp. M361 TaxID=2594266 RepID=UPI00117A237E|nr:AraC family transcriptional regulator [Fulvivirga sp. M361]TRX53043.1 helix-turn-helix domain-containing protein [Fulvivirga sp. M361]
MKELVIHHSISDLYTSLNLPMEQEMDFTIHFLPDIHPKVPFTSPTFRANYYSFVFVKDGFGTYTTDEQVFETKPYTIYFTNPGHVKAFKLDVLRDAYIITLTESFLKEQVHRNIFEEFPFLLAETVPPSTLAPEDFEPFEKLYLQLYDEYQKTGPYKYKIIGNLFVVLLLKIKATFWKTYNPLQEGDRSSQIVKSFKQALERHYRELAAGKEKALYQVQDYAHLQHLHPNYLSNVIKSKTGKSVTTWVTEKTIGEAQSLLKNTNKTVKEISYILGFSEPTHFSSYFKKHTDATPNAYRKRLL